MENKIEKIDNCINLIHNELICKIKKEYESTKKENLSRYMPIIQAYEKQSYKGTGLWRVLLQQLKNSFFKSSSDFAMMIVFVSLIPLISFFSVFFMMTMVSNNIEFSAITSFLFCFALSFTIKNNQTFETMNYQSFLDSKERIEKDLNDYLKATNRAKNNGQTIELKSADSFDDAVSLEVINKIKSLLNEDDIANLLRLGRGKITLKDAFNKMNELKLNTSYNLIAKTIKSSQVVLD